MGRIPVSALFRYCKMMLDDHWGYIFGTAGKLWTQADQDRTGDEMAVQYGQQWVGHRVTDCSGVMVYIWRQYGLQIPHGSSSMVSGGYIVDCGSVPRPGWAALVDKTPDTPDNDHIGIVGEDGVTVYEAKGTRAGFVTSRVTDAKWTKFGRFKDVDYEDGGGDKTMQVPYIARVATASGALNIRSGPGKEYPKTGSLAKGTEVRVDSRMDGWDRIDAGGLQGYVSTLYLEPVREVEDSAAAVPELSAREAEPGLPIPAEKAKRWLEVLSEISEWLGGGLND